MVAVTPGQTPLAEVVTVALGNGYTPIDTNASGVAQPFTVVDNLKSDVTNKVAFVDVPVGADNVAPAVKAVQDGIAPAIRLFAVKVTVPPVPQNVANEEVIEGEVNVTVITTGVRAPSHVPFVSAT